MEITKVEAQPKEIAAAKEIAEAGLQRDASTYASIEETPALKAQVDAGSSSKSVNVEEQPVGGREPVVDVDTAVCSAEDFARFARMFSGSSGLNIPDDPVKAVEYAFNLADVEGDTVYHHFASGSGDIQETNRTKILSILRQYKANPDLRNLDGKTAFDMCRELDDEQESIQWFFEAHDRPVPPPEAPQKEISGELKEGEFEAEDEEMSEYAPPLQSPDYSSKLF